MFDLEKQQEERKKRELELKEESFKRDKETFLQEMGLSEEELFRFLSDQSKQSAEEKKAIENLEKAMEERVQKKVQEEHKTRGRGEPLPPWALFCR